ncbi:MAG: TetR/AcrR family transcriptional regulator [Eubacteriales bacterium]|nr:TetR/AcrR family transcriptional regulator [Eubacteriales bacterium]
MGRKKDEHDAALVKNYISTALLLLMEQNDYQSITVTDIAKKAGVSRMTYYRTYSSKEDILIQYFNSLAHDFMQEIKSRPDITLHQFAVHFLTFFKEHGSLLPTLKKANLLELIFQNFIDNLKYFYTELSGNHQLSASENYHLHFNAGGLSFALILWSESGYKETPEQMAQMLLPFMAPMENPDEPSDN